MRFRNGHISGFIDELTDSLLGGSNGINESDLLREYHEQVSLGSSGDRSLIGLPILFVFLTHDNPDPELLPFPESEDYNPTQITEEDKIRIKDAIIADMNEAASQFNIKFFPAQRTSNTEENLLPIPGIATLDMSSETALKEFIGYDPDIGPISEVYHNYLNHGVAIANDKVDLSSEAGIVAVRGIPHQTVSEKIVTTLGVDFSKIYTVVLAHKLNTEGMYDTEPGWATMTCTHPASEKPFLSFFSIPHLRENILDDMSYNLEDIMYNYNSTYPNNENVTSSYFKSISSKILIGHLVGNTFGLLPIGTPNVSSLSASNFSEYNCESSNDCILLNGNGNCIDISPLIIDNYFSEHITNAPWDSGYWENIVCDTDILVEDSFYQVYESVANYMNFWDSNDYALLKRFTNSQIDYVRAGFETSGTILKSLKDNAINFISTEADVELYCSNYNRTYQSRPATRPTNIAFENLVVLLLEESLNFEKVKNKITSICNKLIHR